MHKILIVLFFLMSICAPSESQVNFTGIYAYNKGINKAFATAYIYHFQEDSAFFYIHGVSGMPDFFTADLKGFLRIDSNRGIYTGKDTCNIDLLFSAQQLTIQRDTLCKHEMNTVGKYKKSSNKWVKGPSVLFNYIEKSGQIQVDSCTVFAAPHPNAKIKRTFAKSSTVKIIDEFRLFYLVEHPSAKKEFTWVLKKHVLIPKK
jgi:hypothetical protein